MNSQYVCCVSINQTMTSLVAYIIKFTTIMVQSSAPYGLLEKKNNNLLLVLILIILCSILNI